MKNITIGTFVACMFLCFMIGFVTCHEIYGGIERINAKNNTKNNIR